jgi:hypothetical protein
VVTAPSATAFGRWRQSAALGAALALVGATAARAELVQYEFAGKVTDTSGKLGVLGPLATLQLGDVFTGRFSYETGAGNPDQEPGDPELGAYSPVEFVIDQAVVPITPSRVGIVHRPPLATLPPEPPDLGDDTFIVAGTFLAGVDLKVVSLSLGAPFEAVFSDDSLPNSLALGDFSDSQIVRAIRVIGLAPDGKSQIDSGQLTSLVRVPEPFTAVMALLGAVGLGLSRRRRRRGAAGAGVVS